MQTTRRRHPRIARVTLEQVDALARPRARCGSNGHQRQLFLRLSSSSGGSCCNSRRANAKPNGKGWCRQQRQRRGERIQTHRVVPRRPTSGGRPLHGTTPGTTVERWRCQRAGGQQPRRVATVATAAATLPPVETQQQARREAAAAALGRMAHEEGNNGHGRPPSAAQAPRPRRILLVVADITTVAAAGAGWVRRGGSRTNVGRRR